MQKFLESIFKLITKENITFILATIGSVGTAIEVLKSRRKLKFKLHYFGYNKETHLALAYIQIDNLSRLPISITDFHLLIDGVPCPCKKLPAKVASFDRRISGKVVSSHDFYNLPFPIQISPLGGASGYFVFEIPRHIEELPSKSQIFQVSANRGPTMKVTLQYDQECFAK